MNNIVETAVAAGSFTTLVKAVTAAGLADTLATGTFTVFAPTDEAFAAVPKETLSALMADPEKLKSILTYHVASGKHMAAEVVGMASVPTLLGESLVVDTSDGVRVGGARVITPDVECTNGVIHVIDTVLIP